MKDMIIGTLTGISAVVAMALLTPRQQPTFPPVRQLSSAENQRLNDLGRDYLPMTEPDPVRRKLDQTTARVHVKLMPFQKVVSYLADLTGQNFYVDWYQLEAAGIDSGATVTLDLQNVPASAVLKAALDELGGQNVGLGYQIIDGVVHISTLDKLQRKQVIRIYNVRDLVEQQMALSGMTSTQAEDALSHLIQDTVTPTVWDGPTGGAVRSFAGRLIVTETPEKHEAALGILSALRRSNRPWPTTQTRTK